MVSSYTLKEVEKMTDMYCDNPCLEVVDRLSVLLNRPRKSIISKLSREGIYITKGYLSKTGHTPITKLQITRRIEDATDTKLPGLDKAPKATLNALVASVEDMATLLEDTLEELRGSSEVKSIQDEILTILR